MIRLKRYGTTTYWNVVFGATHKEVLGEELDNATVIIPQLTSKVDFKILEKVVLETNNNGVSISSKTMCIANVRCITTCLNPARYKYEIELTSETKELEGILCPNLAITKVVGQTRSVYDYLQQYNDEYGTKTAFDTSTLLWTNKYSFSAEVISRFSSIECPEMQWNTPTLREVFNDLMMVDDCIVKLENNVITCLDISQVGSEISSDQADGINYITESQSLDDFVSGLKMNLVNVANNEKGDTIPNNATSNELVGFRNSDTYILTTENIRLETQYPIWKLFSVKTRKFYAKAPILLYIDGDPQSPYSTTYMGQVQIDLTPYILEYGKWQTKDIYYAGFNETQPLNTDYQNTCLYFKRGSNIIDNFSAKQNYQVMFISGQVSVYELFKQKWCDIIESQASASYPMYDRVEVNFNVNGVYSYLYDKQADLYPVGDYWQKMAFYIDYESLDEVVFEASKKPLQDNKRIIADNQTNSYIDINRIGLLEYLKAKRLGNKVKVVNARYELNEANIPQLADTIDGSIIFQKEISIYDNYLDVNYLACDNFVLQDYFTSVKAKIRSWRVVSGGEAFLRKDLIKFFVGSQVSSLNVVGMVIPSYTSATNYLNNFKYCVMNFNTSEGMKPYHTEFTYMGNDVGIDGYMVEFSKHVAGKSVLFTIQLPENTFLGKYVYEPNGTGGGHQKDCYYTDANGEFTNGVIEFYTTYNQVITGQNELTSISMKPCVVKSSFSDLVAKIPFEIHKDQKEITSITIQFEIDNDYTNMFFGK